MEEGNRSLTRGQWLVLAAAFLGWMFDGVEIGLFPLVGRAALQDLLQVTSEQQVMAWMSRITACFLIGAAIGGVSLGWLGDKIGRVRAMVACMLTFSLFTGLCYFVTTPWQMGACIFLAALGMGGEWSLAVALVVECWPERHRPKLAGIIGAACNVGLLFIGIVAHVASNPGPLALADVGLRKPRRACVADPLIRAGIGTLEGFCERGGQKPDHRDLRAGHLEQDGLRRHPLRHSADRHLGGRLGLSATWVDDMNQIPGGTKTLDGREPREIRGDQDSPREAGPVEGIAYGRTMGRGAGLNGEEQGRRQGHDGHRCDRRLPGCIGRRRHVRSAAPSYFGLCLLSFLSASYLFRYLTEYNAWCPGSWCLSSAA